MTERMTAAQLLERYDISRSGRAVPKSPQGEQDQHSSPGARVAREEAGRTAPPAVAPAKGTDAPRPHCDVTSVQVRIPGKPTGKGRPRFSRANGGRAFTPAKTLNYEGMAALFASEAMGPMPPFGQGVPLRCCVVAVFDVPASWSKRKRASAYAGTLLPTGKPDGDNLAKIIGDAFNGVVWRDDSQVVDWRVVKVYGEAAEVRVDVDMI